jgi:flavin reductase (DIM6/NTAB) family NADH-FMN oxidoreductase RutF
MMLMYSLVLKDGDYQGVDRGIYIPYGRLTDDKDILDLLGKVNVDMLIDETVFFQNVEKYKKADLTPRKGNKIDSYIIEECPVSIECKVVHEVNYEGSHRWFIGEIKEVHIDEDYVRDDALMFWLGQFRTVGQVIEGAANDDILKK